MNETKDTIPRRLWRNNETGNLENALRLLYMDRKDESLDYRTLISKAGGWRALYSASGLQTGDRIAIILRHSAALYASFIGAILGGFVPSLFAFPSPKFSKEEYFRTIGLLVDNAQCRLLVTYPELKKELEAENGILPGGVRIDAPETVQEASIEKDELPDDDPDSIAFIQYSSGTTGLKKGVAISHRALLWQVDRYADAIRLGPEDVIVSWLPTYHDMGLIACLMLPILKKTRLVAMSPFDWVKRPGMWPKAVTEHRGTLSWMPNFAYNFMARSVPLQELKGCDLSSVRGLVNCAEPILAESHRALLDRLGPFGLREGALCVSYAMAENTFAVTSSGFGEKLVEEVINGPEFSRTGKAVFASPDQEKAKTLVSSGRPLPETSVRILSDSGQELGDHEEGEIVLRTPCLLSQYYRNPEATAAAIQDKWLYTGDLGYLSNGELFVTGRKKDMIIIAGQNIYPQDIEAIVNSVDGVVPGRNVVFGVEDVKLGSESLVVLAEARNTDDAERERISLKIRDRISSVTEVVPGDVRVLEHMWLRKSTSGKISRGINRERYLKELCRESERRGVSKAKLTVGDDWLVTEVRRCVERVVAQRSPTQTRTPIANEDLFASGLIDSLGMAALLVSLEEAFNVRLPPEALTGSETDNTIEGFAAMISRVRSSGRPVDSHQVAPLDPEMIPMVYDEKQHARGMRGFWSWYYRVRFRMLGVRCGPGLRVLGPLLLRFDGDPQNVVIGRNVTLMPWVDLKIRENGRIVLHDGVALDTMVRLVAARDGTIEMGERSQLGLGSVINAGADVRIGRGTASAGYCTILASEHHYERRSPFMKQGYRHEPVFVGEDVWLAAKSMLEPGSRVGNGAVIGADTVIRRSVPPYAVLVGSPPRIVRYRK